MQNRFLTLTDVAETLNISMSQTKSLVRSGDLPAVKIGGRGIWRVEASMLEDYIQRMYEQTREAIVGGDDSAVAETEHDSASRTEHPVDLGADDDVDTTSDGA